MIILVIFIDNVVSNMWSNDYSKWLLMKLVM